MENSAYLSNATEAALRDGLNVLADLLPRGWRLRRASEQTGQLSEQPEISYLAAERGPCPDAVLRLTAPDGTDATVVVEVKSRFEPRDVSAVSSQLDRMREMGQPLFIAPFLSERSQSLLRERGISFLDLRGNVSIEFDRPAVLLRAQGKLRPNEPSKEPRRSLRGSKAGRLVRFLCDKKPPLGVREIARRTDVSPGNVSRIIDFLDRERYIERDEGGGITTVFWGPLLRRWAKDLAAQRRDQLFFLPRGLEDLRTRLTDTDFPYAVSGSWASSSYAMVAPPSEGFVYIRNVAAAAEALHLRRAGRIANVRLVEAFDRVVFEDTAVRDGLTTAAPTQIFADLLTVPIRSADEIEAFEDWMRRNEQAWRSD